MTVARLFAWFQASSPSISRRSETEVPPPDRLFLPALVLVVALVAGACSSSKLTLPSDSDGGMSTGTPPTGGVVTMNCMPACTAGERCIAGACQACGGPGQPCCWRRRCGDLHDRPALRRRPDGGDGDAADERPVPGVRRERPVLLSRRGRRGLPGSAPLRRRPGGRQVRHVRGEDRVAVPRRAGRRPARWVTSASPEWACPELAEPAAAWVSLAVVRLAARRPVRRPSGA